MAVSTQHIIQTYQDLKQEKTGPVTFRDLEQKGISQDNLRKAGFRGINELKEVLGDEDEKKGSKPRKTIDKETCMNKLRQAYKQYDGYIIDVKEFKELQDEVGRLDIVYHFDGFLDMKKQAGVDQMERERLYSDIAEKLMEQDLSRVRAHDFLEKYFNGFGTFSGSRTDITLDSFIEWANNSSVPIKVSKNGARAEGQQVQLFVKRTDMDFKQQIWSRYSDRLPDSVREMFFDAIGKGKSPKGAAAAIYYGLNYEVTQAEAAEEFGTTTVTLRNIRDEFKEMGYEFLGNGIRGPDGEIF